jgi:hypothetical protein
VAKLSPEKIDQLGWSLLHFRKLRRGKLATFALRSGDIARDDVATQGRSANTQFYIFRGYA